MDSFSSGSVFFFLVCILFISLVETQKAEVYRDRCEREPW